jgi:hypothetical protein
VPYRPDGDFLQDDELGPGWDDDPEERDRGSWWKWAVAIGSLLIFAGVVWYAYSQGGAGLGGPIRTVEASAEPYKVRPDDPGGLVIPDQDKLVFYEAVGRPEEEEDVLAPPPETPQAKPEPIPVRRYVPAKSPEPKQAEAAQQVADAGTMVDAPGQTSAPSTPSASGAMVDRPGQETAPGTPAARPAASQPAAMVDRPGQEAAPGTPAQSASGLVDRPGQETAPGTPAAASGALVDRPGQDSAEKLPLPSGTRQSDQTLAGRTVGETPPWMDGNQPASAPPAETQAAPTASGGAVVQLGAYSSLDSAMQSWEEAQRNYGSVMGNVQPKVVRTEVPGKGELFKLQVGPYADKSGASQACASLKAQGRDCLVHAN